jgi:DnaJ-class molecular chaperone
MPDITENACTACDGLGEVLVSYSAYPDDEPPTKKCTECNGTGEGDVQEYVMGAWRDAAKRGEKLGGWIVTKA